MLRAGTSLGLMRISHSAPLSLYHSAPHVGMALTREALRQLKAFS